MATKKTINNATFNPKENLPESGIAYVFDGHLADFISCLDWDISFECLTFCKINIKETKNPTIIRWDSGSVSICQECLKGWVKFGNKAMAHILQNA